MKPGTPGLVISLLIVQITLTSLVAASTGEGLMQKVIRVVSALPSTQEVIILVLKVNRFMS
jgi:hypothetical protein